MELYDRTLLWLSSYGDGPACLVDPEEIPNEEVPYVVFRFPLSHAHSEKERMTEELTIAIFRRLIDLLQDFERPLTVEFENEVLPAARYENRLTDRPASLGDKGLEEQSAPQCNSHGTLSGDFLARPEQVAVGLPATTGKTADLGAGRKSPVEEAQERLHGAREGVREEDEVRRSAIRILG